MHYSSGIIAALLLSAAVSSPAQANPSPDLQPTAIRSQTSMAEALPSSPLSAEALNQAAYRLNRNLNQANTADPYALEALDLPFLDDLLDDEGNLQLPMGLMIFNTMGDTSVGFGSKF